MSENGRASASDQGKTCTISTWISSVVAFVTSNAMLDVQAQSHKLYSHFGFCLISSSIGMGFLTAGHGAYHLCYSSENILSPFSCLVWDE